MEEAIIYLLEQHLNVLESNLGHGEDNYIRREIERVKRLIKSVEHKES